MACAARRDIEKGSNGNLPYDETGGESACLFFVQL